MTQWSYDEVQEIYKSRDEWKARAEKAEELFRLAEQRVQMAQAEARRARGLLLEWREVDVAGYSDERRADWAERFRVRVDKELGTNGPIKESDVRAGRAAALAEAEAQRRRFRSLLVEWLDTPYFDSVAGWNDWVRRFRPRVVEALRGVSQTDEPKAEIRWLGVLHHDPGTGFSRLFYGEEDGAREFLCNNGGGHLCHVAEDVKPSLRCEVCRKPVREGLRFCSGLSACWAYGTGLMGMCGLCKRYDFATNAEFDAHVTECARRQGVWIVGSGAP